MTPIPRGTSGLGIAFIARIACPIALLLVLLGESVALAASGGPLDAYTGAPAESGGAEPDCTSCHSSFPLDSGPGLVSISAPLSYEPGATYSIQVQLAQAGRQRWGFELTAFDDSLTGAGEFMAGPDGFTQVSASGTREYVKQTSDGNAAGQLDEQAWVFSWTAPQSDIGPVTFWVAGVAGNGTQGASGDDVYRAAVEVPEASARSLLLAGCLMIVLVSNAQRGRARSVLRRI